MVSDYATKGKQDGPDTVPARPAHPYVIFQPLRTIGFSSSFA